MIGPGFIGLEVPRSGCACSGCRGRCGMGRGLPYDALIGYLVYLSGGFMLGVWLIH